MEPSILYSKKKAFILTHLGLGDNITAMPIVRFLRDRYESIVVACKPHNENTLKTLYADDPNISTFSCANEGFTVMNQIVNIFRIEYDIILAGVWKRGRQPFTVIPFNFYDDIGIPYKVFWENFKCNITNESLTLYEKIGEFDISSYAFVHNTTSLGISFDSIAICGKHGINPDVTLVVNPSMNIYPPDHKFHNIAALFANKPFADYITTIINADYIIATDSSFTCIAMQLPLKTDKCYLYPRGSYDHLWNEAYGYNSSRFQKKFIQCLV